MFWLALITLLVLGACLLEFARGQRLIRQLTEIEPLGDAEAPRVSVIVAARNEARKIEAALQSVLRQDYPHLDVLVVNDRSTDETGAILDRLAATYPRLHVLHLRELPAGWLGKTHALQTGAARAAGDWLLFTDADVVMAPDALRRAMRYARQQQLDHLAVGPRLTMPGHWLTMFGGAFMLFFTFYAKPWKARDPRSRRHIGIGAFNLVRATFYRQIGGHQPLALRPDDDMKLGKLIKKHGGRQDVALSGGLVAVEWYGSLREVVRGLEKNSFAGVEYNLAAMLGASVLALTAFIWPFVAVWLTTGATRWLNAGCILAMAALYADSARPHGLPRWHWVGFPVMVLFFQFVLWRATLKTLIHRGIDWRGTHYALADLKANRV